MYAVIVSGGKQYRVSQGDVIYVEKLDQEVDSKVSFDVLMLGSDEGVEVGTPTLAGANGRGQGGRSGQGRKDHHLQVQEQEELSPQGGPPSGVYQGGDHRGGLMTTVSFLRDARRLCGIRVSGHAGMPPRARTSCAQLPACSSPPAPTHWKASRAYAPTCPIRKGPS